MELFMDLGLEEISGVIGIMGKNIDLDLEEEIEVDGKDYTYSKKGNVLNIKSEDGKETNIRIKYSRERDSINSNIIYLKHEVFVDYLLKNGKSISLYNNIGLNDGYEAFENVQRHNLMKGLESKYIDENGKEIVDFSLDYDRIKTLDDNKTYIFTSKGIEIGNRLITLDGENLIAISGKEVPSKSTAKSFDLKRERRILDEIIYSGENIHLFTLELLNEAYNKLDMVEIYSHDILDYYEKDIEDVKKAIKIRKDLMNEIEKSSIIEPKVIEEVERDIRRRTNRKTLTKALIH